MNTEHPSEENSKVIQLHINYYVPIMLSLLQRYEVHKTLPCNTTHTVIKNGILALKYRGLHRAQLILNSAIIHWKWPVDTQPDSDHDLTDSQQYQGLDEEDFDSYASFGYSDED